jgi:hypothetical protein
MTDSEAGATGAQAAPETQPPAGDSAALAASEDGAESSSQPESISLEEARKLRSESASLRKRLKAFEDAEKQRLDADKSAEERATERIAQLESSLEQERGARRSMVTQVMAVAAARKLGFRDPDLAPRLIANGDVEFTDDGQPKNVERLLGDLAKEHPHLIGGTTDYGGGPRGAPPNAGVDMNERIRRSVGRA